MTLSAALRVDPSAGGMLRQKPCQDFIRQVTEALGAVPPPLPLPHVVPLSVAKKPATERTDMEPTPNPRFVGGTAEALAAALKRRFGEGKPIGIKQLAYVLRVSEDAVHAWMNGNRNPRGDHL